LDERLDAKPQPGPSGPACLHSHMPPSSRSSPQAEACDRLATVVEAVAAVRGLPSSTPLAELAAAYGRLRESYREEYLMYGLPQAALAQAMPRMQVTKRR
jgi:hypothetical protein